MTATFGAPRRRRDDRGDDRGARNCPQAPRGAGRV